MKNGKNEKNSGFSLIELIIVIAIMAVLTAVLAPQLLRYVERARIQAVTTECRNLVVAVRVTAIDKYEEGIPLTTEDAMAPAFLTEVRTTAQTPTDGIVNDMQFADFDLSELSYTNRGITVLYRNGTYTVLGRGATPPPPSGPSTTLTKLTSTMTSAERELAIRDNAKALMAMINIAMTESLASENPDIVYMSKGTFNLSGTQKSTVYYDADGNRIGGPSALYEADLGTYLAPLIAAQGLTVGWSTVYFEQVSTSPPKFTTTPTKITFKSTDLTGGTSDTHEYTYDVATGSLTVKKP